MSLILVLGLAFAPAALAQNSVSNENGDTTLGSVYDLLMDMYEKLEDIQQTLERIEAALVDCGCLVPPEEEQPEEPVADKPGKIKVCKVVYDLESEEVVNGPDDAEFDVELTRTASGNSETASFSTPLNYHDDMLFNDNENDVRCNTYQNLSLGEYTYGEEDISGSDADQFSEPGYNDDFQAGDDLDHQYAYDTHQRADGVIQLTENDPHRVLLIKNRFTPEEQEQPTEEVMGKIRVCKAIDELDEPLDPTFTIESDFGTFEVSTPLDLNADIYGDSAMDAECQVFHNVSMGSYDYEQETIVGPDADQYGEPMYNDEFDVGTDAMTEVFEWDVNDRSDGEITLTEDNPVGTLLVVNTEIEEQEQPATGSIRVCKAIVNNNGEIVRGTSVGDAEFAVGSDDLGETVFSAPLNVNADLNDNGNDDAECETYEGLAMGEYNYEQEDIDNSDRFKEPGYNDRFRVGTDTFNDMYAWGQNDWSDGSIVLTEDNPDRTLVVKNRLKEEVKGSIKVCKVLLDSEGNVVRGQSDPGTQFRMDGDFNMVNFATPLQLNADLLPENGDSKDARCKTRQDLELGDYEYDQEEIHNNDRDYHTPWYNDQYTSGDNLSDFERWDTSDSSDGVISLTEDRPHRTLFVKNRMKPQEQEQPAEEVKGKIKVCKAIDEAEEPLDPTFTVEGDFGTFQVATPLNLDTDIYGDSAKDAECQTFDNLSMGSYDYEQETIVGPDADQYGEPMYNDRFRPGTDAMTDVYTWNQNQWADGEIVLTESNPVRWLLVVNTEEPSEEEQAEEPVANMTPSDGICEQLANSNIDQDSMANATGPLTNATVDQDALSALNQECNLNATNGGNATGSQEANSNIDQDADVNADNPVPDEGEEAEEVEVLDPNASADQDANSNIEQVCDALANGPVTFAECEQAASSSIDQGADVSALGPLADAIAEQLGNSNIEQYCDARALNPVNESEQAEEEVEPLDPFALCEQEANSNIEQDADVSATDGGNASAEQEGNSNIEQDANVSATGPNTNATAEQEANSNIEQDANVSANGPVTAASAEQEASSNIEEDCDASASNTDPDGSANAHCDQAANSNIEQSANVNANNPVVDEGEEAEEEQEPLDPQAHADQEANSNIEEDADVNADGPMTNATADQEGNSNVEQDANVSATGPLTNATSDQLANSNIELDCDANATNPVVEEEQSEEPVAPLDPQAHCDQDGNSNIEQDANVNAANPVANESEQAEEPVEPLDPQAHSDQEANSNIEEDADVDASGPLSDASADQEGNSNVEQDANVSAVGPLTNATSDQEANSNIEEDADVSATDGGDAAADQDGNSNVEQSADVSASNEAPVEGEQAQEGQDLYPESTNDQEASSSMTEDADVSADGDNSSASSGQESRSNMVQDTDVNATDDESEASNDQTASHSQDQETDVNATGDSDASAEQDSAQNTEQDSDVSASEGGDADSEQESASATEQDSDVSASDESTADSEQESATSTDQDSDVSASEGGEASSEQESSSSTDQDSDVTTTDGASASSEQEASTSTTQESDVSASGDGEASSSQSANTQIGQSVDIFAGGSSASAASSAVNTTNSSNDSPASGNESEQALVPAQGNSSHNSSQNATVALDQDTNITAHNGTADAVQNANIAIDQHDATNATGNTTTEQEASVGVNQSTDIYTDGYNVTTTQNTTVGIDQYANSTGTGDSTMWQGVDVVVDQFLSVFAAEGNVTTTSDVNVSVDQQTNATTAENSTTSAYQVADVRVEEETSVVDQTVNVFQNVFVDLSQGLDTTTA